MSHSSTELLIDYWQNRISGGRAPTRASINPADFPAILPQIFILGRSGPGEYVFRLAGGLLRDLHQYDLRGVNFSRLWIQDERLRIQTELERGRRGLSPVSLKVNATAGPNSTTLRITLLPLTDDAGVVTRYLGIYEPETPLARLKGLPIDDLQVLEVDKPLETPRPHIRLAAVEGRRVG